jgi:hypothetical protein
MPFFKECFLVSDFHVKSDFVILVRITSYSLVSERKLQILA